MRLPALGLSSLCLLGLSACDQHSFGQVTTLSTEAETRLAVISRPAQSPAFGISAIPAQITCLEPSPDVAKALSSSGQLGLSAQLEAILPQLQSPASAAAAASASRARSEALAQLTERMATIQLLRDGLYRACEAYANGAVSPISYALILSRYGDTMVTLLGAETAAGAFGRAMAGAGGAAAGDATAGTAAADKATLQAAESQLAEARKGLDDALAKLADAAPDSAGRPALVSAVTLHQQQVQDAMRGRDAARETAARSEARATAQPGGTITGRRDTPSEQVAQQIAAMQKTYIEVPHLPPLLVACVTALSTPAGASSVAVPEARFRALCERSLSGGPGLLAQIVDAAIELTREEAKSRQKVAELQADRDAKMAALALQQAQNAAPRGR